MKFFTSFYIIVTAKLVFSSQCHEGYFSEEHKKCISCPEHCLFCDSSKMCLSCEDGYWGNICELPCSRCQPKTSCEKTNGFCLVKCKDGYTGILCDAVCNDKCFNCDRTNTSLCDLCALGHYGESCDKRCPEFCNNKTCNNTGYCTNGCDSGYWGLKCGNNCSSNCKHSSCDIQTGVCTSGCKSNFVGSRCDSVQTDVNVDVSRNQGEENEEKAANDEEGQTANDDKENEASHKGGEIWPVILIVVVVLIAIVSVVVCVVYRKGLISLRQRGFTRQAEPGAQIDSPLIQTRELTTLEDSRVCTKESSPTSLTQDTVKLLQTDTALDSDNEPRSDKLEKIIIIPVFPEAEIAANLSSGQGLPQQDKTDTIEAPSTPAEKAPSPSVKNRTESAKSSDRENATGLDNDSRAEAPVSLESLKVRHVSDFSGTKAYVICKDPTKTSMTVSVFWKLVWQEGCSVIVKLSEVGVETSKRRYWPEKNKECTYGDFLVINEDEVFFDNYRRRTFTIKKDQKTKQRKVEQIQFIKWPIFEFPEEKSLINFRHEVNKYRKTCHGPILVHCRDGFSRSYVFVAMDILLGVLEKKDCGEIENVLIKLKEKDLKTTAEHHTFLRKCWEILSTQMDTKEGFSALPNKASQVC